MPGGELLSPDVDAYLFEQERKDLLRFLTAGSVDDGKSTLIGRLLFDTQMIYEDQLAAVRADSVRRSNNADALDLALLMDGLKAEREQGITIDVAYRYCSTSRRKFIIADCPGHEQYTRNMVTGASNCDLAIILVDARNGIVRQTKRHSFIVSLLGLKHVVVAINKMDLVDYSQEVFERHVREYADFSARLDIPDLRFIPISALKGDNVVEPSWHMPWYRGETLLHYLESVHIGSDRNLIDLRFPVQYVNRPNSDFRGFSGSVASGVLRKGDEIAVLPSGRRTRVKSIATYDGDLQEAFPPMAVTVTLTDELDISRGDMVVHPANLPRMDQTFEAMVVWMGEEALLPQRQYWIKHTSAVVGGSVSTVRYRVDVNTLQREAAGTLAMNEVGRCTVTVNRPICYDPYALNRATGGFIFIDRSTNRTIGAGIIVDRRTSLPFLRDTEGERRRPGTEPVRARVSERERRARFGQSPATIVLTGSPPGGVVEIAYALERQLFDSGYAVCVIDDQRAEASPHGRDSTTDATAANNVEHALQVARLINAAGLICIAALPTRSAAMRELATTSIGGHHLVHIHVSGADWPQPSFSEESEWRADLALRTDELSNDECVAQIVGLLRSRGVIN